MSTPNQRAIAKGDRIVVVLEAGDHRHNHAPAKRLATVLKTLGRSYGLICRSYRVEQRTQDGDVSAEGTRGYREEIVQNAQNRDRLPNSASSRAFSNQS
jgi:hypothetical protein